MIDYDLPINKNDFLYEGEIVVTNNSDSDKDFVILKITLTEENFNFDLVSNNATDFRIVNNNDVLRLFVAYFNRITNVCVIYFKLCNIKKDEVIILKAYWGNKTISSISNPDKMSFIFYESFDYSPLNSSKWSGKISENLTDYGYFLDDYSGSNDNYFTSINSPLYGKTKWVMESGIYGDWDNGVWGSSSTAVGFQFTGTENGFTVRIKDTDRLKHNIVEPGGNTYNTITKTNIGIEGHSYNEISIKYDETYDEVYISLYNRDSYADTTVNLSRQVEGDTRLTNIRVWGRETAYYNIGASPTYIMWLIIRDSSNEDIDINIDGLYKDYEIVKHQLQDFNTYNASIASPIFNHESTFGGIPNLLSNNLNNYDYEVWVSDVNAINEDYISLVLNTEWTVNITDKNFIHYDSGHEYYFNASKLSDKDKDVMNRNYFNSTTSSGWVSIDFNNRINVGAIKIKAVEELNSMPKDYIIYGSNYNPVLFFDKAEVITEDTFVQTSSWQSKILNNYSSYKYYILHILNTYGDSNIKIEEWQMFQGIGEHSKKYIRQLRLHPAMYYDYQSGFPKEISLLGSNNNVNWDIILPWTKTYTPFIKHIPSYGYWQRYSINNPYINGYTSFKLLCRGNWGRSDGKIIIGSWSFNERSTENNTYRIMSGNSNNIQQIYCDTNCNFESDVGSIYLTNDKLNTVKNNKLVALEELPQNYNDIVVIGA